VPNVKNDDLVCVYGVINGIGESAERKFAHAMNISLLSHQRKLGQLPIKFSTRPTTEAAAAALFFAI
jgi:hypothetical protein